MNYGMCGRWRNGRLSSVCTMAGSEECDFECPHRDDGWGDDEPRVVACRCPDAACPAHGVNAARGVDAADQQRALLAGEWDWSKVATPAPKDGVALPLKDQK